MELQAGDIQNGAMTSVFSVFFSSSVFYNKKKKQFISFREYFFLKRSGVERAST